MDTYVSGQTLAAMLEVSIQTIRNWKRRGAPHLKNGNVVRYNFDAIRAWMERENAKRLDSSKQQAGELEMVSGSEHGEPLDPPAAKCKLAAEGMGRDCDRARAACSRQA